MKEQIGTSLVGIGIAGLLIGGYDAFFRDKKEYPEASAFGWKTIIVSSIIIIAGVIMLANSKK